MTQLDQGSPDSPPGGTLPEATAPATAPRQYGTSTDESAKAAPKLRRSRVRKTTLRKAKLDPRNTIPKAAIVERDEQGQRDRREDLRKAGPEHDQAEDQPHVVGLPHWSDRVVDHVAGTFATLSATRHQVPEPGAEVGSAEDRVGHDGGEQQDGNGRAHDTEISSCGGAGWMGVLGPYGTSSSASSRSRKRLLIWRKMSTVVTPIPM